MTLHLKMPSEVNNLSPKISVIGVGGAGGNIVNAMIEEGIQEVEFLNVNTDSQQLKHSKAEQTLQLGPTCTRGLGAGADPEMGKRAAEEVAAEIEERLTDANMVFLTAGMGGGTGTGASPIVAKIAKELKILTVGVVTKPFEMEGPKRFKQAEEGINELQKYVDNLIVIPNQNIFHSAKPDTSFADALQFVNNVLIDGVKSIIDVMVNHGMMNHDFADVRAVMSETGKVHLGTGISEGENRAINATEQAISNPLLENNSISGAKGVLINITCGEDTTLHEVDHAVNRVRKESDDDAKLIWGIQKDTNFNNKFKISVISTGIDSANYHQKVIRDERFSNSKNLNSRHQNKHYSFFGKTEEELDSGEHSFKVNLNDNEQASLEKNTSLEQELDRLEQEAKNVKDKKPENNQKKSLFSRIFQPKEKPSTVIDELQTTQENQIKDEIEIINETEGMDPIEKENSETNLTDINSNNRDTNDLDDDLLAIPAFLRRQAN